MALEDFDEAGGVDVGAADERDLGRRARGVVGSGDRAEREGSQRDEEYGYGTRGHGGSGVARDGGEECIMRGVNAGRQCGRFRSRAVLSPVFLCS